MRHLGVALVLAMGTGSGAASAVQLAEIWRATGLAGPESAVYDPATDALYVTNVAGGPMDHDGNGFVSRLGLDGTILDREWVTGLDAPKGIARVDGLLYVADIDRVVVIDIATADVVASLPAADAKFLNDVTAAPDGRVFVSDMMTDTIWVVAGDEITPWVQSELLTNPNGVLAEADRLVVGSWGRMAEDFSTAVPGHLRTVDYATGTVAPLGDTTPVGNLDGVEPDGQGGYLVTDWLNGGIFHADANGTATLLLDLPQGSADHTVLLDHGLVIVPMMLDGEVVAYRLGE